jgi:hypothetical protein
VKAQQAKESKRNFTKTTLPSKDRKIQNKEPVAKSQLSTLDSKALQPCLQILLSTVQAHGTKLYADGYNHET